MIRLNEEHPGTFDLFLGSHRLDTGLACTWDSSWDLYSRLDAGPRTWGLTWDSFHLFWRLDLVFV